MSIHLRRGARTYQSWSPSQIQKLQSSYKDTSSYILAREMERTPESVRSMAGRLGIKKAHPRNVKFWKISEVNCVKRLFPLVGYRIINHLKRTYGSVHYMVRRLGIRTDTGRPGSRWQDLRGLWLPNGLKAISYEGKRENWKHSRWLLQCHCGNLFTSPAHPVKIGARKSCGCLNNLRIPGPMFNINRVSEYLKPRRPRAKIG